MIDPRMPTELPPEGITDKSVTVYTDRSRFEGEPEVSYVEDYLFRLFMPRTNIRAHDVSSRWLHTLPGRWYGTITYHPGKLPADCPLRVAFGGPEEWLYADVMVGVSADEDAETNERLMAHWFTCLIPFPIHVSLISSMVR